MKRILLVLTCLAAGATAVFSQSVEIDEDEVKIRDTLSVTSDEVKVLGELLVDPDGEDGPKQALLRITEEGGIEIFYVGKYRSLEETVIGMVNPETIDVQSVVVDGGIITSIGPGEYNNITFTGDGEMEVGKYIVYGDFTINQGVTVTVDNIDAESEVYEFFGEAGYASGENTYSSSSYNAVQDNGGSGNFGGGNGRSGKYTISATNPDGPYYYKYAGDGAGGPCGSSPQADGSYAWGGGWILLDSYGVFNNNGQIIANGINGGSGCDSTYDDGGGSGGYIGIRTHNLATNIGAISCDGGDGGNDSFDGGGGGGGVIEIYYYASNAEDAVNGGPFSVVKGIRGKSSGSDGTVRLVNSVRFDELYDTGARSMNEIDGYEEFLDPDVGAILEILGGWPEATP